MGSRFIVDPVEAGFHGHGGKEAVLRSVSIAGCDIDCPPLVVEAVPCMVRLLVPCLSHTNTHPGPLVHHRDGQCVELLLAALGGNEVRFLVTQARGEETCLDQKWPLKKPPPPSLLFKEGAVNG